MVGKPGSQAQSVCCARKRNIFLMKHKGMSFILLWLFASSVFGQQVEGQLFDFVKVKSAMLLLAGACEDGWQCKQKANCPRYLQELGKLETLPSSSPERDALALNLKHLECNEEAEGVCCRTEYEIVGGVRVNRVEDFPFIARIHIKTGFLEQAFCGASLIHSELLLTAKHCVAEFYDYCVYESDCYAVFRDLVRGHTHHEKGEFTVPLVDMFEKEGRSDLAIVKLAYAVCTQSCFQLSGDSA